MEKTIPGTTVKNVDEYLHAVPAELYAALQNLRQAIIAAAPKAAETISYQIPTYKYMGPVVHFAAFKNHCSFFVVNKAVLQTFSKELQVFKTSGTTIHFTPAKPIPSALVKKIVKIRIKQNQGSGVLKKTSPAIKKK